MNHHLMKKALPALSFFWVVALLALPANAETFTLRIGAGQPMKPMEPIFTAHHHFVPEVTRRVKEETEHTIKFVEAYGGSVAGGYDVLEATEKGLFDIGVWCVCLEPTKGMYLAFNTFLPFVTDDPLVQAKLVRMTFDKYPQIPKYIERYNQKFLGTSAFGAYGIATKNKWNTIDDLRGLKIGGAGPNLRWLEGTGAIPVQTTVTEAYNALQSGVYDGIIVYPVLWAGFRLHEPAPVFTLMGWGSISQFPLTINLDTWNSLPSKIQAIMTEVGISWEKNANKEAKKRHEAVLERLSKEGKTVRSLPLKDQVKNAQALKDWPSEQANKLEKQYGLPMRAAMRDYLNFAEQLGVNLRVKYKIR